MLLVHLVDRTQVRVGDCGYDRVQGRNETVTRSPSHPDRKWYLSPADLCG